MEKHSDVLEIQGVFSGYDESEVLHGVSVSIPAGEVVALLGPNGAGKSTLLKTVIGLIRPSEGRIIFDGEDIGRLPVNKILTKGLAYVPQGRGIFPRMTVQDNIMGGAYLLKDKEKARDQLERVYALFPRLRERKDALAGVLSGGERQMLTIGRMLMLTPKLIMLDEPSLGLDPKFLSTVYQQVQTLNETGTSILLVEQNVKKALSVADRAYVLEGGRIILQGTAKELENDDRIKSAYLGSLDAAKGS